MPRIRFDNCVDYRMAGKKKDKIEDIKLKAFTLILNKNLESVIPLIIFMALENYNKHAS